MSKYSLSHVSDAALARDLAAAAAHDRASTANLLAHIAEFDARKLYRPAAHPSMFSYCVGELGLSEDAAYKRIQVARTARQFPAIFPAVADGRLHLTAVLMLAPHLTPQSAEALLAAAAGRSKAGLERLIAERFPRPDLPERIQASVPPGPSERAVAGPVGSAGCLQTQLAPERVEVSAPARVAPLAPERYGIQFTFGQEDHDNLHYAQALLGHQLSAGEIARVFGLALEALIPLLERRKFAATHRPRRRPRRPSSNPRHIPAAIKCAVWERDQGQCTFKSESGRRCPARTRLEYDHVDPVARGGQASVEGIRLRCRAHNQFEAERCFGAGFMERKREEARRAAAARKAAAAAARRRQAAEEVIPYLRELGFRGDESRAAAALCEREPDSSLERRVKLALSYFANRHCTRWRPAAAQSSTA